MTGQDGPRKAALMEKLKAQIKALEEDLAGLEAKTAGSAKMEVMLLRKKKDEFNMELDEVERAGDEAWDTMIEGLRVKAFQLKESFERLFLRHKQ